MIPVQRLRVLGVEVGEGLRAILREPTALVFSVLMPVGFYALFTSIFGTQQPADGLPYAATSLATYGTFGVVSVMLLNPGIGVAEDRTRGWLRLKMVSATPIGVSLAARVVAALPYSLGVIVAMSAVSLLLAGPVLDVGTWVRLVVVLVVGSLPFALFGLAVGFSTSSHAAAAILNALLFPMVLASGLWVPLELMPGWVQAVAPFLPTYHLAELAEAQLTGAPAFGHLLAVLLTTALGALAAGAAYRNLRV
ncbi:ABC transporter permease [Pseudonocardia saturnea]